MIDILILAGALFATQDAVTSALSLPLPDTRRECRVIGETGSRLARRRTCATRAEMDRTRLPRPTESGRKPVAAGRVNL